MSERVTNLQLWLHAKGTQIEVDGKWGPATRSALIETFRNRQAQAATLEDIAKIARNLGCSERQLRAFAHVESGGNGWDNSGLLKCLWERHYLFRRIKLAVPFLSDPSPGGYTIDADHDGINDSWEKLADATGRFGFNAAAECASFGKFQIMGAHWQALGYRSVADFIWRLSRTELEHYLAFAKFIEVNGLLTALRQVSEDITSCRPIARGYNGKGQKGYDARIAMAYQLGLG